MKTLKDIRMKKGLHQKTVADTVGVSLKTWNNWENGRIAISPLKLPYVLKVLKGMKSGK